MGAGAMIAIAVLLAFASLHEVMAARAGGRSGAVRPKPAVPVGLLGIGLADRIRRAGLAAALSPRTVVLCKLGCSGAGALVGAVAAPGAPGRLAPLIALAMPAAGFLGPDALLERWASRRRRRLLGSLPDALDLLGAGAASGRSMASALAEAGGTGEGPLRDELAATAAEISCGLPQREALRSQRRAVEEQAARAAPKIQLVVALVLVPAVLLIIAAGLIANSDRLLSGLI
jgi:tight adherence protein C